MINENIQVVDLDATHIHNLTGMVAAAMAGKPKDNKPRLIIIHEHGKVLKAFHSERGAITQEIKEVSPEKALDLAETYGAGLVLMIEKGGPRRMMHLLQSRVSLDQNLVEQGFAAYSAVRESLGSGDFVTHPVIPLKNLSYAAVVNIAKLVVPANELFVMVVFDPGREDLSGLPIFTSVIMRFNRAREIDFFTTTDGLVPLGLGVIDNWKKDYTKILKLTEKNFGKVFLAVFADLAAIKELGANPPGQMLKAFSEFAKQGKLIVDPFPLKLKMLIKAGGLLGR
jgi:hypothetical protein